MIFSPLLKIYNTGRGAGATVLFARAIVAYLCGQEKADEIARSMMCPDL